MLTLALSDRQTDKVVNIALACASSAILATVLIFSIGPRPPPPQAVARDTKADLPKDLGPRIVRVERFMREELVPMSAPSPTPEPRLWWPPQPVPQAATADWPTEAIPPAQAEEKPDKGRDVCSRHGMRKVMIDGGKRWRCRK